MARASRLYQAAPPGAAQRARSVIAQASQSRWVVFAESVAAGGLAARPELQVSVDSENLCRTAGRRRRDSEVRLAASRECECHSGGVPL